MFRGFAIFSLIIALFAGWTGAYVCYKEAVTDLKATVRSGQVFPTWDERPVLEGVTFNAFISSEGISVMERMNNERIVLESQVELPFLVLCNGRNDGSIPWINNPSFYQALNRGRRGFACYWNNGGHSMGFSVPEDISSFYLLQPEMTLSTSFPAFTNFSDNCNPGNGEIDNGDSIGWMNRGIYWADIEETGNSWSIRLQTKGYFLPDIVFVDVTPRRLTRFQIALDEMVLVNGQPVMADKNGLLTIPKVQLEPGKIVSLKVRRSF